MFLLTPNNAVKAKCVVLNLFSWHNQAPVSSCEQFFWIVSAPYL